MCPGNLQTSPIHIYLKLYRVKIIKKYVTVTGSKLNVKIEIPYFETEMKTIYEFF